MHLIGQLGRGGAEKQLWRLSTAMLRRGWPQAVVAFRAGGAWAPRLLQAGIPVACISEHPIKPWRLWQLSRLIRQHQPQVVMSWSAGAAAYARWICGQRDPLHVVGVRFDLTVNSNTSKPVRRVLVDQGHFGTRRLHREQFTEKSRHFTGARRPLSPRRGGLQHRLRPRPGSPGRARARAANRLHRHAYPAKGA